MHEHAGVINFAILSHIDTQNPGFELSLTDLHHKALFIPKSSLDNFIVIGQG